MSEISTKDREVMLGVVLRWGALFVLFCVGLRAVTAWMSTGSVTQTFEMTLSVLVIFLAMWAFLTQVTWKWKQQSIDLYPDEA